MSRTVTLVLINPTGTPLGTLAPFDVLLPWWQEVADIVVGARERFGLDISVLRLLAADRPAPPGGAVTYLAEVADQSWAARVLPVSELPERVDLRPHPLRAAYAEPGGPAASVAWAAAALERLGRGKPIAVAQQRTWNLAAIWRLEDGVGPVWLKHVPAFFDHESAVLSWLRADDVPVSPAVLAADAHGRMLLEHVAGDDCYGASTADREAMAAQLHTVQLRAVSAAEHLVGLGVPDRRGEQLHTRLRAVAEHYGKGVAGLAPLLSGLADRLAAVRRCGLPDTLVHGDFHPGNVRADGERTVILDWGDSFVGHPAFDALRMSEGLDDDGSRQLLKAWDDRWRHAVPGCDPLPALNLLRPVAALGNAATYAEFVDHIEPSERPYHASDIAIWLHVATEAAATG